MNRSMNAEHLRQRAVMLACLRPLWWRFRWAGGWFAPEARGLHFWAGMRVGNVRLWGRDFLLQVSILAFTVPGVWLAGGTPHEARQGFVLLLLSQPFWLVATWRARQFGAFAVAVLFTALWIRAVLNSF